MPPKPPGAGTAAASAFTRLHREWQHLATSTTATQALRTWARHEPVLAGYRDLHQLTAAVHDTTRPARADAILAALVRRASITCGDDHLAARTMLQLLLPGAARLAGRIAAVTGDRDDAEAAVLAELTAGIRTFPWQRRHRAIAANLLLDARQRLIRRHRRTRLEVPTGIAPRGDLPDTGGLDSTETALAVRDLFRWAHRHGIINRFEARLLIASRLQDIPVTRLTGTFGRSRSGLYQIRAAAEHRLRRALYDPDAEPLRPD